MWGFNRIFWVKETPPVQRDWFMAMMTLVGDKMRPRQYCLFLLMVLIPLSEQKVGPNWTKTSSASFDSLFFFQRDFYFHLDSCDTESANPKICEVNCTLTKKGDVLGVSGFMNILEPADGGGLSIELKIRKLGGDKYLTFINQTVPDACVYLKGNSRLNIVQIGIDELIKSGKVPGCPVEAVICNRIEPFGFLITISYCRVCTTSRTIIYLLNIFHLFYLKQTGMLRVHFLE